MAFLESLRNAFSTLSGPADAILGLDFGSSSLKVVELHKSAGRVLLHTYGEIALGPYDEKQIGEIAHLDVEKAAQSITDVIREASVTCTHAVIGVPSSQSLLFVIELPAAVGDNLATVVPSEARKYIPVPLTEVILDWLVIPEMMSDEEGEKPVEQRKIRLLVAATRTEALQTLKLVTEKAGLTPVGYEIESFAQVRAGLYREISSVLLVDFGASRVRMSVVRHGVVYMTGMLSFGAESWTQSIARSMGKDFAVAEQTKRMHGLTGDAAVKNILAASVSQFATEIRLIIAKYEQQYQENVERIVLLGGGAQLPGLVDVIATETQLAVHLTKSFERVAKPRFLEPVLQKIDPVFATSVGLGMRVFES